eukprot:gene18656-biopygen17428
MNCGDPIFAAKKIEGPATYFRERPVLLYAGTAGYDGAELPSSCRAPAASPAAEGAARSAAAAAGAAAATGAAAAAPLPAVNLENGTIPLFVFGQNVRGNVWNLGKPGARSAHGGNL